MTQKEILKIIKQDTWMMDILKAVRTLHLPDWWIGAGFVRGKVWDYLHGYTVRTPLPDLDVIYFDREHISVNEEISREKQLSGIMHQVHWQIKNQARMHPYHNDKAYKNAIDALARWVEVPTCVAVTLDGSDALHLAAPHGISDLVNLVVRPTPYGLRNYALYLDRMRKKQWNKKWPKLHISFPKGNG